MSSVIFANAGKLQSRDSHSIPGHMRVVICGASDFASYRYKNSQPIWDKSNASCPAASSQATGSIAKAIRRLAYPGRRAIFCHWSHLVPATQVERKRMTSCKGTNKIDTEMCNISVLPLELLKKSRPVVSEKGYFLWYKLPEVEATYCTISREN